MRARRSHQTPSAGSLCSSSFVRVTHRLACSQANRLGVLKHVTNLLSRSLFSRTGWEEEIFWGRGWKAKLIQKQYASKWYHLFPAVNTRSEKRDLLHGKVFWRQIRASWLALSWSRFCHSDRPFSWKRSYAEFFVLHNILNYSTKSSKRAEDNWSLT